MDNRLPEVDFCGLRISRLVLGANPFGGYSHQSPERDREMVAYYTVGAIKETWRRAEAVGITAMVTNNETPHVVQAVREYLAEGGKLQWIAQLNGRDTGAMLQSIDKAVAIGCRALYFHGGVMDRVYSARDESALRTWYSHARSYGLPVGVAGHAPEVHRWVDGLGLVDFHAVCFFNCGSLHNGRGDRFSLDDIGPAIACIQSIKKPCIGYKIMGAGRIDPRMSFEYALGHIKSGDVVNVGMYRGDRDAMVEENAALVREILAPAEAGPSRV